MALARESGLFCQEIHAEPIFFLRNYTTSLLSFNSLPTSVLAIAFKGATAILPCSVVFLHKQVKSEAGAADIMEADLPEQLTKAWFRV